MNDPTLQEDSEHAEVLALDLLASGEDHELARLARRAGLPKTSVLRVFYLAIYGAPADREYWVGWMNREHIKAMRRDAQRAEARTRAVEAARERAERAETKT